MSEEITALDTEAPWMKHLERAHARIHVVARFIEEESEPNAHLAPAARELERGLGALYDAFDGRFDRITSLGRAHARVWGAAIHLAQAGLSKQLASLQSVCAELIAAEERFPRVPLPGRSAAPLRAGGDRLPLHTIERESLVPTFRTPPIPDPEPARPELELPEPKTFEELAEVAESMRRLARERAVARLHRPKSSPKTKEHAPAKEEPPPGFAFVPEPAISEDGFVRQWARTCFEEIGMLGIQRTPLLGDDWRACQSLELRMVASLDALAALGPIAIAYVEPLAMDAPAADPMRIYAAALMGGCLEGRDALAIAERVLHRFGPGDPVVADAFVSAMKLATNPFAPNAMRALYTSSDRACRAIAVEVMGYRGWFRPEELDELCEGQDARVFALALPAIAKVKHRGLERALSRALSHEDLDVQAAALDAMAIAAHPRAAAAARVAAEGALGDRALVPLSIVGDEADARWLWERMQRTRSIVAIEAVGWAGLVDAVPALIGLLESEEDEVKLAAGAALEKMLGANLVETIEVEPERLEEVSVVDPNPEPLTGRLSLAELVSDPRDKPPAGKNDTMEVASADPAKWRAYWTAQGGRFEKGMRVRRGKAYSGAVVLYELEELALSAEERRRLGREMAARTGRWVGWEGYDFVAVQVEKLQLWQ